MSTARILVVEDERIVATSIKNELENFGYACSGIAGSADDAVAKAVQDRPDLVLMDIHLKGEKDGIVAAGEIHRRVRIPVVFLSAFADAETVARAGETEPFGYLVKPYEEQELRTTIEMSLAKHRAEQRLLETDRWLAAVFEGIDNAVIASDAANRTHFMNLVGEALTGWRRGDGVGKPLATVCHLVEDEGRVVLEDLVTRAVSESRTLALPATARLVSRDGRETPIEGCLSPIHDEQGEFLGTVLSLRDISARLELEKVRRQNEEQRRQAQKMEVVRSVGGGMANHLNNLLTVILGNTTQVLADSAAAPRVQESLRRIETAGHRAVELVERLLIISERYQNQQRLIDLNTSIPEWLKEIRLFLESQIRLEINFAHQPNEFLWLVNADEAQLKQAVLNLCLNALDAMPQGGRLTLETENVALSEEDTTSKSQRQAGKFVRLRVTDTGLGMTAEVRGRIFEPFFTTKEPGRGVGLGLALVYAVVEQQHGWIECSSEEGRGTSFDLYLPRYGDEVSADLTRIHLPRPEGATPTILLADPDPIVRDFGRHLLEAQGYQVLLAGDGLQAIAAFCEARARIDLVILDLNLPRLTQNAIIERLVEIDPNVRVLLSSGYFPEDLPINGGHIVGVICKPYGQEELVNMVRPVVEEPISACSKPAGQGTGLEFGLS